MQGFWFRIGALITPVCFILALLSAETGHGNYLFFKTFYPFLMALIQAELIEGPIVVLLLILMLVQFPLYGVLIDIAKLKDRAPSAGRIWLLVFGLLASHVLVAGLCFSPYFSK